MKNINQLMPTVAKLWPDNRPMPYFQFNDFGNYWEAKIGPNHSGSSGKSIEEALFEYAKDAEGDEKSFDPIMADYGPVIEFLKQEVK